MLVAALAVVGSAVAEAAFPVEARRDWRVGVRRDWPAVALPGLARAVVLAGLARAVVLAGPAGAGVVPGRVAVGCLREGLARGMVGELPARLARVHPGWAAHAGA